MTKILKITLLSTAIFTGSLCATPIFAAENIETGDKTVVAKFNNSDIYKWEAEDVIKKLIGNNNAKTRSYDSLSDDEKTAVAREIATKRVLQKNIEDSKIADEEEVRKTVKLVAAEVVQNEFLLRKARVNITPSKIKEHYEKIVAEIKGKEEFRLRHILVEKEEDAKKIRADLLKKPETFAEIAKEKSKDPSSVNGGDTGYALQNLLLKEIETAALSLKKGEISEPIKTSLGWNIIKLEDKRKANIAPFDTIKEKIEQELIQQSTQLYLKSLLDDAKVELVK